MARCSASRPADHVEKPYPSVSIRCDNETAAALEQFGLKNFAALCIVSEVKLEKADTGAPVLQVTVQKSPHKKCRRCWNYWPTVGSDPQHPDVCQRCVETLKQMGH